MFLEQPCVCDFVFRLCEWSPDTATPQAWAAGSAVNYLPHKASSRKALRPMLAPANPGCASACEREAGGDVNHFPGDRQSRLSPSPSCSPRSSSGPRVGAWRRRSDHREQRGPVAPVHVTEPGISCGRPSFAGSGRPGR